MNIDKLIKEDKLDPINRLIALYSEDKDLQCWGERIVCFLYAFDRYMQKFLQTKYNYYILGDLSVFSILNKLYTCDNTILSKTIIALDNAKVIYRFTVAKKFLVDDKTIKQLRLNSWGKEYYQYNIQKIFYEEIDNTVKNIIVSKLEIYEMLVKEFKKNILDIKTIEKYNEMLDIKIVF